MQTIFLKTRVLDCCRVTEVPPMDALLFSEYVLPAFKEYADEGTQDVAVRIAHASCIVSHKPSRQTDRQPQLFALSERG